MRGRRHLSAAVGIAFVLLLLGACSNDDPEPSTAQGETQDEEVEPNPTCLSGKAAPSGVDPARPAVAVKIENSPAARPQSGLEHADLVIEERVEGGITRFMAIYHCGDDPHAGPVRSARFDDPKLAKPFTTLLAASGSNLIVEDEVKEQKMDYVDEKSASGVLFRDPPGSLDVHSLFANTKKLRKIAVRKNVKAPTQETFVFGGLEGRAKRARRVTINFTLGNTIEYRWQGNAWKRYEAGAPFMTASGRQIAVPNLFLQEVRVDNSDHIVDSVGFPSPDIHLEKSKGKALLFRDGKVVKAKWKMKKVGDPPVFTTRSGDPLVFAPGPVWIELVPSKAGEVKGFFSFK